VRCGIFVPIIGLLKIAAAASDDFIGRLAG